MDGFQFANVSSPLVSCTDAGLPSDCKTYVDTDTGTVYKYYYPKDDSVQYLHETYPDQISPIDGVTDEHFIVWMRAAMFPTFRKLYGKIHHDFKKGDELTITITANYEVGSFDGTKGLLLSTLGDYGGRNKFPGEVFLTVGSFALIGGCLLLLREVKNVYF
ncbi:hypothetical protein EON65_03065 [archaeon]|nr:MAG: hypothetical protein EON65_03065 [archaeon]